MWGALTGLLRGESHAAEEGRLDTSNLRAAEGTELNRVDVSTGDGKKNQKREEEAEEEEELSAAAEHRRLLLADFKQYLINNELLRNRVTSIWTSDEARTSMLAAIAAHIPIGQNPIEASDLEDRVASPPPPSSSSAQRQKTSSAARRVSGECVVWTGPINKRNKYAAVRLQLPDTREWWITYTSRVIVFVFGNLPHYSQPDDFHRILNLHPGEPFAMKCNNPTCVRLSHIDYKK